MTTFNIEKAIKPRKCSHCKQSIEKDIWSIHIKANAGRYPISINVCEKCMDILYDTLKDHNEGMYDDAPIGGG